MKIFLSIVFCLIFGTAHSQCFELLSNKIDSMEIIPYYLHDKLVDEVESGKTIVVTIRDVEYKSKRFFLFQQNNLGDTLDVALMTLNKKVLARKYITKDDYILSFPKINFIEHPIFDKVANSDNNVCDLSFYWKDHIKIKYVNNNYLGPNVSAVISYYNELLL
jgi:hypothetical protein